MKQTTYWHTLQVIILLLQSPCTHASQSTYQPTFTREDIQKIFFKHMRDWADPLEAYPTLENVKNWIKKGANVNGIEDPSKEEKDQPTPLIYAIKLSDNDKANFELINLLLENGADINGTGKISGQTLTPLQAAVRLGKAKVVEFLLDKGVSAKEIRDADIKALNNAPKVNTDNKKATLDMLNSKGIQLKTNSIQGTQIRAYKKNRLSRKETWCVKVEAQGSTISQISFKKNTDNMVKSLQVAPRVKNTISVYKGSCDDAANLLFSTDLEIPAPPLGKEIQIELGTSPETTRLAHASDVQEPKDSRKTEKIRAFKMEERKKPWCVIVVDETEKDSEEPVDPISEPVKFKANTDGIGKSVKLEPKTKNYVRVYKGNLCRGAYDQTPVDLTSRTIESNERLVIHANGVAKLEKDPVEPRN